MTKYDPRRASEGERFTYNDAQEGEVRFRADEKGIVRPRSDAEKRAADAFGLPVARKVAAQEEADAPPAPILDDSKGGDQPAGKE